MEIGLVKVTKVGRKKMTWIETNTELFICIIIIVAIWSAIWKMTALWKCGRNNQLGWFVIMAIFNTAGILPILYILFFQEDKV